MTDSKTKTYKGMGHEHTARAWAKMLNMRCAETFIYNLEKLNLTIEEMFERQGLTYPAPKERKQRGGARMRETQERMYQLLVLSGYPPNDISEVVVKPVDKNGNHLVSFNKRVIGTYNYREGTLKPKVGEGIPVRKLDAVGEVPQIYLDKFGYWRVCPKTLHFINELFFKERAKELEKDPLDFDSVLSKHEEEETHANQVTYEGFGKSFTCAEWARRLGVPRNTLWRHLTRGETIEEFAAERGIKS